MVDHEAIGFVAALRERGLDLPPSASIDFVTALGLLDPADPDDVYWAARSTLVASADDITTFDAGFAAYFMGIDPGVDRDSDTEPVGLEGEDDASSSDDDDDDDGSSRAQRVVRWTASESLRTRDFADCSPEELAEVARAIDALRISVDRRRTRRWVSSPAARGPLDLRRTVAAARRSDGEVVIRRHRRRAVRPRRLMLIVDVSGSMEPYARVMIRFAHAARMANRSTEAFAVGTRVTRLTRDLAGHDADAALDRVAAAVPDWSGGTRLAAGIGEVLDRWGQGGVARGAVVVILSDGWDRGDPGEMEREMSRLARLAHRVVWVNPLRATPGYAPLARGMAAALPHCDAFVDGHSLESLDELARLLGAP